MPRLTTKQKVERQRLKADQERAKLRSLAAKQAAERRKENRNKDTRRKILGGVLLFQLASMNASVSARLKSFIESLEERDKEAFDGWEIPAPPPKP